uniref:Uncharacterized protein n=1 Tax=Glossina pallidipes TaxID=7398 RepID=A0A1A9Z2N1_GLOPL
MECTNKSDGDTVVIITFNGSCFRKPATTFINISIATNKKVVHNIVILLRLYIERLDHAHTIVVGRPKTGLIWSKKCLSPKVISVELLTATLPILGVATDDGVVPKLCALPSSSPMMLSLLSGEIAALEALPESGVFKLLTESLVLAIAVESVEIEQLLVEVPGVAAVAFPTSRMVLLTINHLAAVYYYRLTI